MTRLEQYQAERLRALEVALEKVWKAFQGGPAHPWIPGGDDTKQLREDVAKVLGHPVESGEVLGYYQNGKPIYPIQPGMITTAACIVCKDCRKIIASMGGPAHGATCPKCHLEN